MVESLWARRVSLLFPPAAFILWAVIAGWSRSSTLVVVCYLAVEWERAPDCSSAALSLRIPLVTANLRLGLVVQQFAEGVNSPVVLRLRGGMQIFVTTLTGKTIT